MHHELDISAFVPAMLTMIEIVGSTCRLFTTTLKATIEDTDLVSLFLVLGLQQSSGVTTDFAFKNHDSWAGERAWR